MRQDLILTLILIFIACPACLGQTAPASIVNKGTFTNTQMNEGFQSLVNGCSPASEFQQEQNGNNSTDAIVGCVQVPEDATVWNSQALAGYGNNSSTTTNAAGVYAAVRCLVTGSHCWGSNPVVEDVPRKKAASLIGEEIDINVSGSPVEAIGLQITGYLKGALPSSANAIWITPSIGSQSQWPTAINVGDGASKTGLYLGTQAVRNNQPSSRILFAATDTKGTRQYSSIGSLADGSLQLSAEKTINVAGHTSLGFSGDGGQHFTTARANNDTVGEIGIANATEAVYRFNSPWGAGTPPVCTATPTSDPSSIGSWWISYATDPSNRVTELQIHLHTQGTIRFNYICIGNPA